MSWRMRSAQIGGELSESPESRWSSGAARVSAELVNSATRRLLRTHIRLPINDDEIIDRALAVQPLADRPVTLLTYDTGQSTRARAAELPVIKLAKPLGDEPT
jgi:PIN domain